MYLSIYLSIYIPHILYIDYDEAIIAGSVLGGLAILGLYFGLYMYRLVDHIIQHISSALPIEMTRGKRQFSYPNLVHCTKIWY